VTLNKAVARVTTGSAAEMLTFITFDEILPVLPLAAALC
jgi:hypothetical protein